MKNFLGALGTLLVHIKLEKTSDRQMSDFKSDVAIVDMKSDAR